jgi:pimeloyl-ACP methyl ester carboxylesterase
MPVARVNDIELNYRLEGNGEDTIVLINGLADDHQTWVLQMDDFLAAGYRVLRFDNRGIGASSKPAGPYTSRMLADDAKALADSLGITGFHLMGISMGGMIAQEYALAYPGDLRSVTFACTYAAPLCRSAQKGLTMATIGKAATRPRTRWRRRVSPGTAPAWRAPISR